MDKASLGGGGGATGAAGAALPALALHARDHRGTRSLTAGVDDLIIGCGQT